MVRSTVVVVAIQLLAVTSTVTAIEAMFEGFNKCEPNGILECRLRVRKINRTTAALFGTIDLKVEMSDHIETAIEAFHSPLGNNQFNKYPMKIGPVGMCQFVAVYWADYYSYMARYIENLLEPGVCPIGARLISFNDMILDGKMLPQVVPTGLWKLLWRGRDTNNPEVAFELEFVAKIYVDGFL
ncbi:conserved hypothetical protein [Culex quinquefasciatus]|uniref:MD-2-related lipid-recognition domain-containing protein n=1 Tax=Culex quinquefasciatus TaxID=7176 RepID=B0WTH8_CULQU|nr:conserved hypothetical protein [Culex quinquefasciatus]|eukprot:XP_001854087.1 conserved hypothetical protein [Culex quinquefasciatus]